MSSPNDVERLGLFLDLASQHEELARTFPVDQRSFTIGGAPRPPADEWHRLVRAFSLRKFFLQRRDTVHFLKVYMSLFRLAGAADPESQVWAHEARITENFLGGAVFGEAGGSVRAPAIVADELYGTYLHGDFDRWQRVSVRSKLFVENALWSWTATAERELRYLRDLIVDSERSGHISLNGIDTSQYLPATPTAEL